MDAEPTWYDDRVRAGTRDVIRRTLDPVLAAAGWSAGDAGDWAAWDHDGGVWLAVGLRRGRDPSVLHLDLRMGTAPDLPADGRGASRAELDEELHPDDPVTAHNARTAPSLHRVAAAGDLEPALERLRAWLEQEPRVLAADQELLRRALERKLAHPAAMERESHAARHRGAAEAAWAARDWLSVAAQLEALGDDARTPVEELRLVRARRLAAASAAWGGALDRLNTDDGPYLGDPLPSELDATVDELVAAWTHATPPERQRLAAAMTLHAAQALGVFAERMASLAVRRNEPSLLPTALAALVLAARVQDERELILVTPLVLRSATDLGLDPVAVWAAGLDPLQPDVPAWLTTFLDRDVRDRSIEVMGYVAEEQANGLLYRRTW